VIARLTIAKERPPSETEAKINTAVFDNPNTRTITSLLWKSQFEKYPPEINGHVEGWAMAKQAVATHLLYETNEMRLKACPISNIKNKIRITHAALGELRPRRARPHPAYDSENELAKQRTSSNTKGVLPHRPLS
jgi:hypothetical protein